MRTPRSPLSRSLRSLFRSHPPRSSRAALPALVALILALAPLAAAQRVDFLDGELDGRPLCELTRDDLTDALGIPSRADPAEREGPQRLVYGHLGLAFALRGDGTLERAEVSAVPDDELRPYRGHFLGPIASDTTRAPVLRLLRAARADLGDPESDRVLAELPDFRLVVRFWEDWITGVELRCPASPDGDL